jgi:hypothetical protein
MVAVLCAVILQLGDGPLQALQSSRELPLTPLLHVMHNPLDVCKIILRGGGGESELALGAAGWWGGGCAHLGPLVLVVELCDDFLEGIEE